MIAKPIFAADRSILRLKEAAEHAHDMLADGLKIEIICGHWKVEVRGAGGVEKRVFHSLSVEYREVMEADGNIVLDLVDRVAKRLLVSLAEIAAAADKKKA